MTSGWWTITEEAIQRFLESVNQDTGYKIFSSRHNRSSGCINNTFTQHSGYINNIFLVISCKLIWLQGGRSFSQIPTLRWRGIMQSVNDVRGRISALEGYLTYRLSKSQGFRSNDIIYIWCNIKWALEVYLYLCVSLSPLSTHYTYILLYSLYMCVHVNI